MKPEKRYDWIIEYIIENKFPVDICNSDFVNDYIDVTNAKHRIRLWGAPACPQLARDLKILYERNALKRYRTSIQGMGGLGFPKWVWSYKIGLGL